LTQRGIGQGARRVCVCVWPAGCQGASCTNSQASARDGRAASGALTVCLA
jgi:hypothetical protein